MRAFVIADASKRRARPAGLLTWEPDTSYEQGRFSLELSSEPDACDLPLSLSFCAARDSRRATPEESEAWVRSRIVPEDRHNIAAVLRANGLVEYDVVSLFAACEGRSSDDDLLAYEIDVPDELAAELAKGSRGDSRAESKASSTAARTHTRSYPDDSRAESETPSQPFQPSRFRVDRILASLERRQNGAEVTYVFVKLPVGDDTFEAHAESSSAKRAGALIRSQRRAHGLTQTQLAERAGITQTVLSRLESGNGNPTLNLFDDVAAALGMHLNIELRCER